MKPWSRATDVNPRPSYLAANPRTTPTGAREGSGGVAKFRTGVRPPRTMDDLAHDMVGLYRTLLADAGI
jgi:hypothetical protein